MHVQVRAMVVGCVLLTTLANGALADATSDPPASEALVLEVNSPWFADASQVRSSHYVWTEHGDESARFVVGEASAGGSWSLTGFRIDPKRYPRLSLTYVAQGMDTDLEDGLGVWLSHLGTEGVGIGERSDFIADGQPHTLTYNLEELIPPTWQGQYIDHLIIPVVSNADGPAVFELRDLRFVADSAGSAAPPGAVEPLFVQVTDPDGEPLVGATVVSDPMWRNASAVATTDDDGVAIVQPTTVGGGIQVRVEADGFAPAMVQEVAGRPPVREQIPTPLSLPRGKTYGGRVVDEAGVPLEGAVLVLATARNPSMCVQTGSYRNVFDHRVRTDSDGRWVTPVLPDLPEFALYIRVVHPDTAVDPEAGTGPRVQLAEAKSHEAVITAEAGSDIFGTVTDQDGRPLANAQVRLGKGIGGFNLRPAGLIKSPATTTDADGRYLFERVAAGPVVLTVTADAHAPELLQSDGEEAKPPFDFTLAPARPFRARLVDGSGTPVAGATLTLPQWRQLYTLTTELESDADGMVAWDGPAEPVFFRGRLPGRTEDQRVRLEPRGPNDDPQVIALYAPLEVGLRVTDTQTGEPIDGATAVYADIRNNVTRRAFWVRRLSYTTGPAGQAAMTVRPSDAPQILVRVEAPGYAAWESPLIDRGVGRAALDAELQPVNVLTGRVVSMDGDPLEGVDLYYVVRDQAPGVRQGRIAFAMDAPMVTTDADGGFTLTPDPKLLVIAAEPRGYLRADAATLAEQGGELTLEPWATIGGRAMVGDRPAADQTVVVEPVFTSAQTRRLPNHRETVQTDADGRFEVAHVAPGLVNVKRVQRVPSSDHTFYYATLAAEMVDAKAGATTVIDLGGRGRPVTGRLVGSDGDAVPEDVRVMVTLRQLTPSATVPRGANAGGSSVAVYRPGCRAIPDAEGAFRFDDIVPGTYHLRCMTNFPPGLNGPNRALAGEHRSTIVVPALSEDVAFDPDPLDLGEITLK